MTKHDAPTSPIDHPLDAKAQDYAVDIEIPGDGEVTLTADAAEISALRLLDAADKARSR